MKNGASSTSLVMARDDLHAGTQANLSADGESACRVQEALLTDPRTLADLHSIQVVPFENRVVPYVYSVPELYRLRVKDSHSVFQHDAMTEVSELIE
jgi:hypothetical protein